MEFKNGLRVLIATVALCAPEVGNAEGRLFQSLEGTWQIVFDRHNEGREKQWVHDKHFPREQARKSRIIPLFDGLPVDCMMGPVYENVWAQTSLVGLDGAMIAGAIGYDWFPDLDNRKRHYFGPGDAWFGSDMSIVPLGKGRCILSQFRLVENLGKDPVADKLLYNLIEFAAD